MRYAAIVLTSVLVLLGACDKKPAEPTVDEMKVLVGENIKLDVDRTLTEASKAAGHSLPGFEGFSVFNKKSCTPLQQVANSWTCEFDMTFKINGNQMSTVHKGTFARDAQGTLSFAP